MAWSGLVTAAALLPIALLAGEQILPATAMGWVKLFGLALIAALVRSEVAIASLKWARKIAGQKALEPWVESEMMPGEALQSDDELLAYAQGAGGTIYHPVGTCRMGNDAAAVVDPTGCGDAWRGALLFGLEKGWSLAQCAALGNQVGALKIAQRGPQNYTVAGLNLA